MQFEAVRDIVDGVPNMTPEQGRVVYDLLLRLDAKHALELGFAHGTGSCYMGAALQETGGSLLCIDREEARQRQPSLPEQVARCGLEEVLRPLYSAHSYTWELMRLIEEHTVDGRCAPFLDFCYIDGAHAWEPDGLAFFLVDKLLKVDGWILFDDIYWRYSESSVADADWVQALPRDERDTAQVLKIFELLVKQHPNYADCRIVDWWGWARKVGEQSAASSLLDDLGVRQGALGRAKQALRPAVHAVRRRLRGG